MVVLISVVRRGCDEGVLLEALLERRRKTAATGSEGKGSEKRGEKGAKMWERKGK